VSPSKRDKTGPCYTLTVRSIGVWFWPRK
jgi:hypothetical protein